VDSPVGGCVLIIAPLSPRMVLEQRFSAFFYGTLLHPKILRRVIGNDGSHLEICPAVLLVSSVVLHSVKQDDRNLAVAHCIGPYETPSEGEETSRQYLLWLNADFV